MMTNRIDYIDGFRGVASFIVFTGHFLIAFYPIFNSQNPNEAFFCKVPFMKFIVFSPLSFFYNGHFAVMAFFILSGYVLSYQYFVSRDPYILFSSLFRRYFRFAFPIFFSCLLAYLCLKLDLFFNHGTALITNSQWLASFYTFKPSFVQMVKFALYGVYFNVKGCHDYNNPLWVMPMVLVGSYMVFALLFLCSLTTKRFLIYLPALFLMHKTYYLGFILGIMLCDENTNKALYHSLFKSKVVLVSLLLLGVTFGNYKFTDFGINGWLSSFLIKDYFGFMRGVFYHTIGAFFIVYVLLHSRIMKIIFSQRFLTYMGTISFSLYITHFVIICSLSCFLFNILYTVTHLKFLCFIVTWVVTMPVTIGVSHLFYVIIERQTVSFTKTLYSSLLWWCTTQK